MVAPFAYGGSHVFFEVRARLGVVPEGIGFGGDSLQADEEQQPFLVAGAYDIFEVRVLRVDGEEAAGGVVPVLFEGARGLYGFGVGRGAVAPGVVVE